jgi:hypothetical protein
MSYSGSMSLATSYMASSSGTQSISNGLFEAAISSQHVFHNQFKIPAIAGNSSLIFSIALLADNDSSWPTASVSIANADTISSRVGNQIAAGTYSGQRSYQSTNPFNFHPRQWRSSLFEQCNILGASNQGLENDI